jgi:hypothetical protein
MAGTRGLYRVWIANLSASDSNNRWNAGARFDSANLLREIFKRVVAEKECPYTAVDWYLFETTSTVAAEDLLLYILPSSRQSIIDRQGGQIDPNRPGNTFATAKGVISEIYLGPGPLNPLDSTLGDANYTQLIANLAFHELMHNKLDALPMGGGGVIDDIHRLGGGGLATGGKISSGTSPTPTNLKLMARNLGQRVPQFTQAVTTLVISAGMPKLINGRPAQSP